MAWSNVLQRLEILNYNEIDRSYVEQELFELYLGSLTLRGSLDAWANSGRTIFIFNNGDFPAAEVGTGRIFMPLASFDTPSGSVNSTGVVIENTFQTVLAHEIGHAVEGLLDDWQNDENMQGGAVRFENMVREELGLDQRISYAGSSVEREYYSVGDSFTDGNEIDTAALFGYYVDGTSVSLDRTEMGSSRDLLIGDDTAQVMIGGAGKDYIYGNGGEDIIIGAGAIQVDVEDRDEYASYPYGYEIIWDYEGDVLVGGDGRQIYITDDFSNHPFEYYFGGELYEEALDNVDRIRDSDGEGLIHPDFFSADIEEGRVEYTVGDELIIYEVDDTWDQRTYYSRESPYTLFEISQDDGTVDLAFVHGDSAGVYFIIENFRNGDFGVLLEV